MTADEESKEYLVVFAKAVREKFSSIIVGHPEDQLKNPIENLVRSFGIQLGHTLNVVTESDIEEIGGTPDIEVAVDRAPTGYIELKKPGMGGDPSRFTGRNAQQWQKFKAIPNLIYTDGNAWGLYRSGQRIGEVIDIGEIDKRGVSGLKLAATSDFLNIIRQFLSWEPIPPTSPRGLAKQLAPLCRFLRDDVLRAVKNTDSALYQLASEWRSTLFPDAKDEEFADAYAQTLTYALLLARFDGATDVHPSRAAETLNENHKLLGQVLTLLADPQTRKEIGTAVDILVRIIGVVDPSRLMEHDPDPWLYFYEDFLAEYDPKMRDQYGVFFTPVEVVRSQVRLVGQLLTERFGKTMSYADEEVVFLDPAAGTGTYPLAAMTEAIEKVQTRYGVGAIPQRATILAMNVHAFELLVGPYSVAHLRVTQKLQEVGATLPDDGVHVYLTDTLESPDVAPPGRLPLSLRPLVDEHRRAGKVKKETRVLVCMGNPPYERQAFDASEGTDDNAARRDRLLGEFITLARGRTKFSHLASLYNKYVYFWRWALWKVFDSTEGPGIVSFITASSYLNGPGFLGMREVMRRTFDELWIIDLEGGNLGARKTENVFAIETPVAIAIGVRYGKPNPDQPANVRYAKITGTRREKLSKLDSIKSFNNLDWQECSTGWTASLIPSGRSIFSAWPLLTDLFPWQTPGVKVGRTWPIATTTDNAKKRWQTLAVSSPEERSTLFPDRRFGRKTTSDVGITNPPAASRERIIEITERSPIPLIIKYAHRSFDRKCILADPRIIDLQRPPLWFAHSEKQVYLTSLLTDRLGFGPAATVTSNIPDLHYFHGRGGKDIIPLWRNQLGTEANITAGLLNYLENVYGKPITPEDFFAYCYAILAGPEYTRHFANDLATSAPRIPISTNPAYFDYGVNLGRQLIWIHTYGTRFVPINEQPDTVLAGKTRAMRSVPVTIDGYPRDFSWDETTETLHVGDGTFAPVSRAVWDFEVSGLRPLRSWLGYRMKKPTGKKSSPLDEVRPDKWPAEYTEELLELLWVLEYTVNRSGELTAFFESVIQGEVMVAGFLPQPNEEQRKPPEIPRSVTRIPTEQLSFDK